jgi:hypothetical protein
VFECLADRPEKDPVIDIAKEIVKTTPGQPVYRKGYSRRYGDPVGIVRFYPGEDIPSKKKCFQPAFNCL